MKPNQIIALSMPFGCAKLTAQFPNLAAPKLFGGTKEDVFQAVVPTFGNGYIAVGYTWSTDFDGVGNRGSSDFFIKTAWNASFFRFLMIKCFLY